MRFGGGNLGSAKKGKTRKLQPLVLPSAEFNSTLGRNIQTSCSFIWNSCKTSLFLYFVLQSRLQSCCKTCINLSMVHIWLVALLRGRNGSLSKIFAVFWQIWSLICKVSKWFGTAENWRKQETAGNRRKSQEAVSTPFSHLVSPTKRCPRNLL